MAVSGGGDRLTSPLSIFGHTSLAGLWGSAPPCSPKNGPGIHRSPARQSLPRSSAGHWEGTSLERTLRKTGVRGDANAGVPGTQHATSPLGAWRSFRHMPG